ncbi:hypothetical protein FAZ78_11800 [Cereibacter changlensis]|uniref:Core-binding (CB) domain-containing protein n=1 Tax=Cereibacter changlensis TaxID=402884 RepID=A0A4U0Z4F1_9RHOB|nr:hypothetical protein FAZ78_11800 [Cereibacter changlensis]
MAVVSLAISPAARAALEQWLDHLRVLDGVAANTLKAYTADVSGYLAFMAGHRGGGEGLAALATLPHADLRAWMAHERGRGVAARSLARSLSAVKGSLAGWPSARGWTPPPCSPPAARSSAASCRARWPRMTRGR